MPAFVLIHSPFVGPFTWQPTAHALEARGQTAIVPVLDAAGAQAPYWPHYAGLVAAAAREVPGREPLVLVAHSAAGLLVPAARAVMPEREVRGYVFVDAALPRAGISLGELIPAGAGVSMTQLRAQAEGGLLPPWGAGWPDDLWRDLIPDAVRRARFVDELRPAPLALYEERTPVVGGWPDAPCRYLRLSALYAGPEGEARRAGWPTRALSGGHLHMLVQPADVANALIELTEVPRHPPGSPPAA